MKNTARKKNTQKQPEEFKLSPEEYREILEQLELFDIVLINANVKREMSLDGADIKIDIDDKMVNDFKDEENQLDIRKTIDLKGKIDENNAFNISAEYLIQYHKPSDLKVSKDFIEIFSRISLNMIVWPYFREYIHNMTARMGLPALTLPLIRS